MTYRTDKFSAGDSVTWFDDDMATFTRGREKHGDGPFTIHEVLDREEKAAYGYDDHEQTTWESMGHTQHVLIDINGKFQTYSGAFFKKID